MFDASLTFHDLTLGYHRHPAVHHLGGTLRQGSLTARRRRQRLGQVDADEGHCRRH